MFRIYGRNLWTSEKFVISSRVFYCFGFFSALRGIGIICIRFLECFVPLFALVFEGSL